MNVNLNRTEYNLLIERVLDSIYVTSDNEANMIPSEIIKRISPTTKNNTKIILENNDYLIPLILGSMVLTNSDQNSIGGK